MKRVMEDRLSVRIARLGGKMVGKVIYNFVMIKVYRMSLVAMEMNAETL